MKFLFFLIFFLFSFSSYAEKYATVNFQKIYDNSTIFNKYLEEIEDFKKEQLKEFKKIEKILNKEKKELENSKIILSDKEFENEFNKYEKNIQEYQIKVDKANKEILSKMEKAKNTIKNEVIKILQEIAIEKNIKIIFDSDNYIIAMKEIDLTGQVIKILNSDLKNVEIE
ncbi:MAG: hypothetical protein CFH22_00603 [Alphaproteobacteria bacterium MarineAlpha5_Bin12]|nr:MAG: hypothetical protein CFH22_00603 [Alphaproteobacteria bacterium MarineAlpha5_Bin12]|tara:strand:+ start:17612 stop:18121 length:510 start_codon:yes stop_codon:yes gene_type:complete